MIRVRDTKKEVPILNLEVTVKSESFGEDDNTRDYLKRYESIRNSLGKMMIMSDSSLKSGNDSKLLEVPGCFTLVEKGYNLTGFEIENFGEHHFFVNEGTILEIK